MTAARALGRHAPAPRPHTCQPGERYTVSESAIPGLFLVVDQKTGLGHRAGAHIGRYDEPSATLIAHRLNTARLVCVACRHKALASECVHKVCPTCQERNRP